MTGNLQTNAGSSGFFKTLFEESPFAMQIYSTDGDVVKINTACHLLWGIHPVDPVGIYNIFKDKQARRVGLTTAFTEAVSGKNASVRNVQYNPFPGRAEGRTRFLHVRMLPLEQLAAKVEGVVCILEDITEPTLLKQEQQQYRERLEQDVETRTSHLESLLHFSTRLTSLDNLESIYVFVSSCVKDLFKFDYSTLFIFSPDNGRLTMRHTIGFPQSMVGSFSLLEAQGLPSIAAREQQAAVVEDFQKEVRVAIPDIIFEMQLTSALAVPMLNKHKVVGVLIGHTLAKKQFSEADISLYQNIANQAAVAITNIMSFNALQRSEEQFRQLFENSNDAIYIVDAENNHIIDCNNRAMELDGYSRGELLGEAMEVFYPKDEQKYFARERTVLFEKGSSASSVELHHRRKNGELVPVELSSTRVEIRQQALIMHTLRDISQRKVFEKEREAMERKSRRAQKMEAIGLMASGVAHDLNNILSGVVSYPELILMQLPDDSPIRSALNKVMASGQRAADVVADLLTVARGAATVKKTISLNHLIQDYMVSPEILQLCARYPQIKVYSSLVAEQDSVDCSKVHIQKIFLNLFNNAMESIEGSGKVEITSTLHMLSPEETREMELETGEYILLMIRDSGAGISEHDREHIFDPFYTTKKMGRSGTGLGLTVVWNTIRDHDGSIRVESGSRGTVFSLYLPVISSRQTETSAVEPLQNFRGEGVVLVVDDVKIQRDIAVQILTILGYQPVTVSSGEEAVAWCEKNTADLIVLDMVMDPGINGREAYEQILRTHPGQKALVVSGYSDTSDIRRIKKLGVHSLLKKPYSIEELGRAVQDAL